MGGLVAIKKGEVHMAGTHLLDFIPVAEERYDIFIPEDLI